MRSVPIGLVGGLRADADDVGKSCSRSKRGADLALAVANVKRPLANVFPPALRDDHDAVGVGDDVVSRMNLDSADDDGLSHRRRAVLPARARAGSPVENGKAKPLELGEVANRSVDDQTVDTSSARIERHEFAEVPTVGAAAGVADEDRARGRLQERSVKREVVGGRAAAGSGGPGEGRYRPNGCEAGGDPSIPIRGLCDFSGGELRRAHMILVV